MSEKNVLQEIYLFKGLNPEQLAAVSKVGKIETCRPGDDIFNKGDSAKAMYFIKSGSVRIHQKSASGEIVVVATLGSGSHFGEMPFLDGEKRSASATAIETTEIVAIDYQTLQKVLGEHQDIAIQFYRQLAHFLCWRLRITTNDLSFAREKNLSHF